MIDIILITFMISATINILILLIINIFEYFNYTQNFIIKILCPKCITFWFTLFIFGNILIAGTASLFSYLIDKYLI